MKPTYDELRMEKYDKRRIASFRILCEYRVSVETINQRLNMKRMIENMINGNCSDARRQARRFSQTKIRRFLTDEFGWDMKRAVLCAEFLKTGEGFQAYCDAS